MRSRLIAMVVTFMQFSILQLVVKAFQLTLKVMGTLFKPIRFTSSGFNVRCIEPTLGKRASLEPCGKVTQPVTEGHLRAAPCRCSARRIANATMVRVGLALPAVGNTELPATYRLAVPWTRQLASTTP